MADSRDSDPASDSGESGTRTRVEQLFHEAIALPADERGAFLEETCGGNEDLRLEVESLIRLLGEGTVSVSDLPSLQAMTHDKGTDTLTAPGEPVAVSEAAREIGPYRILETIGEGGMGTVYLAEQREPVRRKVALKVIKLGMDTKEVLARFEAERQALALMSHPCIAKVFDAGITAEGRPYFTMEYVAGDTITEHCDRQRLNTKERLRLFMKVCDGVQHAHQKGVIHRDIKPSNILVNSQSDEAVPHIIDFGVAKAVGHRLTEHTLFTEQGQMIGTPEYMSPEQAQRTADDIDTRSDVYSLGVLLYELLVGQRPFDLSRASYEEIQRIIREEDPAKPSTRLSNLGAASTTTAKQRRTETRSLVRQVRGDLDWITMKALEKDRARRYESVSELAADVGRHLNHEPVVAGPPSRVYRLQKFVRKNRGFVAATGLIIAALAMGLSWSLVERGRAVEESQRADAKALEAEREADDAKAARALAQQNEREALEERARADAALARVLRLSDIKLVVDFQAEADQLWPAHPEQVAPMQSWLANARELYDHLPAHREELARLRKSAIAQTPDEAKAERDRHPRLSEMRAHQGRVKYLGRLLATREGREVPAPPEPDWEALPRTAAGLNSIVWPVVDPQRRVFSLEAEGLAIARYMTELAPEDPIVLDTLSWALFANGHYDEAVEASRKALARAPEEQRDEYQGFVDKIEGMIASVSGDEGLRQLREQLEGAETQVAELEAIVSARWSWRFEDRQTQWQHEMLSELVDKLVAFGHEETGVVPDLASRLEWAQGIEERSVTGAEARLAWARAVASISNREECPAYHGLVLEAQVGLLPLDRNPRTGLWEFWHMQSGERPEPQPDAEAVNRWLMAEDTGLVLVLIPGGPFRMGAETPAAFGIASKEAPSGLRVTRVVADSLAARMGVAVGDVITEVSDQRIESPAALASMITALANGSEVTAAVLRGTEAVPLRGTIIGGRGAPHVDPDTIENESPVHEVTLPPYFLSKYEMTQGQWLRFVGRNPSNYGPRTKLGNKQHDLRHPVELVSWRDCDRELFRLGLALPTEAQWECGTRAGTTSVYWTGDSAESIEGAANIADSFAARHDYPKGWTHEAWLDDGYSAHAPVGAYRANAFGLHDVIGNVWEWCLDGYGSYALEVSPDTGERDAPGARNRVFRGGGFSYPAVDVRSALRFNVAAELRFNNIGVRPSRCIATH